MKQSTSSATLSTAESSSYTTCDHQLDVSQRSSSPHHMLDWSCSATAQKKQQPSRRRRASASSSSKQCRRHSLQELDPTHISAARRLSGQSTSSESSQPRVKLLHASKPMHRTLSNQDLSGILRHARYSSTNSADMAAGYEPGAGDASSPLFRKEINRISNEKKASLLDASVHPLDFRLVSSLTRRSAASSTGQLPTKSR